MSEITQILDAIAKGDKQATEDLLPLVYHDLRQLAARRLANEAPGQTLQATALVHEAYLKLIGSENQTGWDHRGHFYVAAAEAMRRILINRARDKRALKRGGDAQRQELQEADLVISVPSDQLLDLDEALELLAQQSPEEAKLVKLRFFAGLTLEETAEALGISRATASRYWAFARAFLQQTMSEDNSAS